LLNIAAVDLKNLYIEQTPKTPLIDLNHLTGELILSGRSIPENAAKLYENIFAWVVTYAQNPRHTTNLRLNLEYFNTASSIWLAKIVKVLSNINKAEFTVMVHLYFEIEEYDSMQEEDIKDALSPLIDLIGTPTVSLGIRIYGTGDKGEILKDSMVLL
jgi:hypothetical protein